MENLISGLQRELTAVVAIMIAIVPPLFRRNRSKSEKVITCLIYLLLLTFLGFSYFRVMESQFDIFLKFSSIQTDIHPNSVTRIQTALVQRRLPHNFFYDVAELMVRFLCFQGSDLFYDDNDVLRN